MEAREIVGLQEERRREVLKCGDAKMEVVSQQWSTLTQPHVFCRELTKVDFSVVEILFISLL